MNCIWPGDYGWLGAFYLYGWFVFGFIALGAIVAGVAIPVIIRIQRANSIGQQVYEDGPSSHIVKQGTPTMGGLAFPLAAVAAVILSATLANGIGVSRWIGIWTAVFVLAVAGIGFVDDFFKLRRRRALGLRARTKMLLLTVVAFVFVVVFSTGHGAGCNVPADFDRAQLWFGGAILLPTALYYALAILAVVGSANAVNLTDGVDGLASATVIPPLIALALLSGDAVVFAILGALIVFYFFNSHPAIVFMGDTGSLTLGALLAFLAVEAHAILVLPLLGIVFVVESLSVIVQVASFKITGKRIFKMSPLHHHFELSGWSERKITAVFFGVSLIASVAVCALYLRIPPH
jgi:phospho-N-acetylmuramoyl-pentapeptide-transferase